jgi:hypothetical protein
MSRRWGEASQPVCHQGQMLLVYHNLFLEDRRGFCTCGWRARHRKWWHSVLPLCAECNVVVTASVFWHGAAIFLAELLHRRDPINSHQYVQALKKSEQIWRVRPNRELEIVILHENARLHSSLHTREATVEAGQTVLPHPPYSPNLSPSKLNWFCSLKDALRGIISQMTKSWNTACLKSCDASAKSFMRPAYSVMSLMAQNIQSLSWCYNWVANVLYFHIRTYISGLGELQTEKAKVHIM